MCVCYTLCGLTLCRLCAEHTLSLLLIPNFTARIVAATLHPTYQLSNAIPEVQPSVALQTEWNCRFQLTNTLNTLNGRANICDVWEMKGFWIFGCRHSNQPLEPLSWKCVCVENGTETDATLAPSPINAEHYQLATASRRRLIFELLRLSCWSFFTWTEKASYAKARWEAVRA